MHQHVSKVQQVVNTIHQYILQHGGQPSRWYVGIARHTDRLFVDHCVDRTHGLWIYEPCGDSQEARAAEKALLDWGCKGGGGGGDAYTTIVYAYLITGFTRE